MQVRIGIRLRSQVDSTEVILTRVGATEVDLRCGGHELISISEVAAEIREATAEPAQQSPLIGKRYSDEPSGLELLCVKSGQHRLTADGRPMPQNAPRPLPASD